MFKLMLVEDEPIIREGLKYYFDWENLHFTTIIEAENGQEGIELALKERPDLIITDIRMPVLNGLDMIEQLRSQLPNSLFVILTGYSDFEYAKRAIQLGGITEYLLKPLQYDISLATIEKCSTLLLEQQQLHLHKLSIEKDLILHEQFKASDFIRSILTEENDWSTSQFIGTMNIDQYCFSPFIFSYIPSTNGHRVTNKYWHAAIEQLIQESTSQLVGNTSELKVITYYWKNKVYGLILCPINTEVKIVAERNSINDKLQKIYKDTGMFLFLSQSETTHHLSELQQRYKLLEINLYQRYFRTEHYYALITTPSTAKKKPIQLDDNEKQLILQCLQLDASKSIETLKLQFTKQLAHASPESLLAYMQELISITVRFAQKNNIQIEGIYNDRLFNLSFLDDFISLEHLINRIGEWIVQLNRDYSNAHQESDLLRDDQLFPKIEKFIIDNIDQDITLQMVAVRFFYNPSYLSRLFKQKLNKNYSLFQAEVRIKYAQKCLADPQHSVVDICNMSGYRSYKHFVKTFKLVTNMTPTVYRKQLGLM
ncbi:MAG: response regulator [Candidatus Pristimantibacillus lignocellulolyticus]|uniref:Response regulator n=1 Tax=Candidatus Pristimantibacillus lignocellulolyticus TaxID=2994561 RepID=A0A9J6ZFU5_9BACL|nr:MAG: response regulator [Candidatus Pristimantibacillus lignocellulolyticus]